MRENLFNAEKSKRQNRQIKAIRKDLIIKIKKGNVMKMNRIIEILNEIKPGESINESTRLIDGKIIDSLAMISLVAELSDEFDVDITAQDIIPENFETPAAILKMIERLENED